MFSEFDRQMMRLALDEARLALDECEIPVGAVITRGSEVIARAHNSRERAHDPTGHAEINALRKAARLIGDWRLTGCVLYVTLEPCCMCAGAIGQARPDRLIFGAYDEAAGCCASVYRLTEDPAFSFYVPSDGGLLAEDCAALIRRSLRRPASILSTFSSKSNSLSED